MKPSRRSLTRPSREYSVDTLLRGLCGPRLSTQDHAAGDLVYRALYMPSFNPECCITVHLDGLGSALLAFSGHTGSLWSFLSVSRMRVDDRDAFPDLPCSEPTIWDETVVVSGAEECAAALSRASAAVRPEARQVGIDGMPVFGEGWDGSSYHSFDAWSPRPGTAHHEYFALLYRLAADNLSTDQSTILLEQLHGYLELGLPVKDLGGVPRHVRLFGMLSFGDKDRLRAFFAELPPGLPLLMDLSNFEGMGTLLYPCFRQHDARSGPTAWLTSEAGRAHLVAIGIPSKRIFSRREAAVASLTDP